MTASVDTFCVGPWAEIRINSDGSLNYCHYADNAALPAPDSVLQHGLDHYFHRSQTMIQVRDLLKQGRTAPRCHRCYQDEAMGCISFRQRRNIQSAIFPGADFDQSLDESGFLQGFQVHSRPRFYHVSFSNLCNMACMMCHSQDSTRFDDFVRRAGVSDSRLPVRNDWTQGPAWQDFCQHLLANPDIVCLHIMGGEPMYHRRFRELLHMLTEQRHTDFHFTFVTNGTIYDAGIIDLLLEFRSVAIEISIEGFGLENDYVRHGSNTAEIVSNIHRFLGHRSSTFDVVLRTVPQALSVMQYHRVLEFCRDNAVVIDSNPLHDPPFLHAGVLPPSLKHKVRQRLEPFLIHNDSSVTDINLRDRSKISAALSTNAKFVLAHLDREPLDPVLALEQLTQYCARWDRTRGYDARRYLPELADVLHQHGYAV